MGYTSTDTTDYTGTRNIVLEHTGIGTVGAPNNNLFVKPCIESVEVEYGIELNGQANTFLNGRYEGAGAQRIYIVNSLYNVIIGGYKHAYFSYTYAEGAANKFASIGGEVTLFNASKLSSNSLSGSSGWELATFSNRAISELTAENASCLINNGNMKLKAKDKMKLELGYMAGGAIGLAIGFEDGVLAPWVLTYYGGQGGAMKGNLLPRHPETGTSGDYTLGSANWKWNALYAVNGTIQTSDERAKTEISAIPDEWLDAWAEVDYTRFKMIGAIQKKGLGNARWHIGLIAQRVKEVFEAHGLDAMQIGLLCYDEWDDIYEDVEVIDSKAVVDEEGNIITPEVKHTETQHSQKAGNLYSIRYDEALAMEAAYMRREVQRLKAQ